MELVTKTLIICGTLLLVTRLSDAEAIVNMGFSQVRGLTVDSQGIEVAQYLGIPYAEAPVYDDRFKKPKPKAFYPTVVLAYDEPPSCWQASKYPFPMYDANRGKSEECLYLNIWTPKDSNSKNMKAVIFWIHGGGFRFGSIRQSAYFGAPLAALGDVVVVTVNYRVGAFGFLTSGTEDAPGNVGLYDILEALKWVNKNIESFGGDASQITIAGEGSGSDAVGLLSVSPLAKGLFRRQIMQSGSPAYLDDYNKQINMAISQAIAEGLDCADKNNTIYNNATAVVDCLRHVSPSRISEVHSIIKPHSMSSFVPQFGDDLLPASPRQSIVAQNFTCKEVLIGNVRDEGSYLITTADPRTFGFFGEKAPHIGKQEGQKMIRQIFQNFPDPEGVVKQYISNSLTDEDYRTIRHQVYKSAGDISIVCPTTYYAEKCAENGGNVFYYLFRQRPSDLPWAPWMGVTHGSEVEYVFGVPILHNHNYFKREVQFSAEVIDIWSSFAKFGKPSIPWPLYSKDDPVFVNIGPGPGLKGNGTSLHGRHCDFFRPYFGF